MGFDFIIRSFVEIYFVKNRPFLFEGVSMIYVLIMFVSSFSLFSSPAFSESNQRSDCKIDTKCLGEVSEILKTKTVIRNKESSSAEIWKNWHSLFKVVSPPPLVMIKIGNSTVQLAKKKVQPKIKTAKTNERQTEILAQFPPFLESILVFPEVSQFFERWF